MSKLSKAQAKAHAEAERLLKQDHLSEDDRLFVIENWQESARHINSIAGAFFTPWGLARDFSIEVPAGRLIDLCAGMGTLALARWWRGQWTTHDRITEVVCVEVNPDYAAVGQKLLPEARWIVGDIFDLPRDIGRFNTAISNPPFGTIKRSRKGSRFTGTPFELHVIDIASDLANWGVFIVPQMSAPFRYSGCPAGGWPSTIRNGLGSGYADEPSDLTRQFLAQTAIEMQPNCGIDTEQYRTSWHGVSPLCEVVVCDFEQARSLRGDFEKEAQQLPLFAEAAE